MSMCKCGHAKEHHIYHEGACRPGFVCEKACTKFEPMTQAQAKLLPCPFCKGHFDVAQYPTLIVFECKPCGYRRSFDGAYSGSELEPGGENEPRKIIGRATKPRAYEDAVTIMNTRPATPAPIYDKSVVKRLAEQMGLLKSPAPSDDEKLREALELNEVYKKALSVIGHDLDSHMGCHKYRGVALEALTHPLREKLETLTQPAPSCPQCGGSGVITKMIYPTHTLDCPYGCTGGTLMKDERIGRSIDRLCPIHGQNLWAGEEGLKKIKQPCPACHSKPLPPGPLHKCPECGSICTEDERGYLKPAPTPTPSAEDGEEGACSRCEDLDKLKDGLCDRCFSWRSSTPPQGEAALRDALVALKASKSNLPLRSSLPTKTKTRVGDILNLVEKSIASIEAALRHPQGGKS